MSSASVGEMCVLVVDDNADLVEVIAEFLEREHDAITAVTATDTDDALERLDDGIDCVVSDYDLPGTDGLAFLDTVREAYPDLPFILFTGKGSEEIASEAISAGVTDYLQKQSGTDQYTVLANRIERAVSERRARTERAETERQLATLIENLDGMVYRCRNEPGWPMTFVSDGCENLTGYSAEEIESGEVSWGEDVLHPDDREEMWETVQTALDADEAFEVQYRIRRRDGDVRWCWERGQAIDSSGDATVLEGFITDITPRKRQEEELRTRQKFIESILDAIEDIFFVVDPETEAFIRWNERLAEATGYDPDDLEAMRATEVVADDHRDRVRDAMAEAVADGTATVEADVLTADGERIPHEFRGTMIRDGGTVVGVGGIGRDVSDRKARERDLQRYETVVQAVGDPVYVIDEDGVVRFANEAFSEMTGYDVETLVDSHMGLVLGDDDLELGREHVQELLDDPDRHATKFEVDIETADGKEIPSELHIALLPTDDGSFRGTAGIIRDIEQRKNREQRLEEFASVVSHDLRGPLSVVRSQVELAKRDHDLSELDAIEDAAERMAELIDELLTLARQGESVGEVEVVSLDSVARGAWQSIDAPDATLDSWTTRTVAADSDRLRELFENLFQNAVRHGRPDATVTVGELDGGFYVADDGPGIPESEREDVFDHGYTTEQRGTGFGLSIVERIADAHGWSVRLTESEDGGARFEFRTG